MADSSGAEGWRGDAPALVRRIQPLVPSLHALALATGATNEEGRADERALAHALRALSSVRQLLGHSGIRGGRTARRALPHVRAARPAAVRPQLLLGDGGALLLELLAGTHAHDQLRRQGCRSRAARPRSSEWGTVATRSAGGRATWQAGRRGLGAGGRLGRLAKLSGGIE